MGDDTEAETAGTCTKHDLKTLWGHSYDVAGCIIRPNESECLNNLNPSLSSGCAWCFMDNNRLYMLRRRAQCPIRWPRIDAKYSETCLKCVTVTLNDACT